MATVTKSRPKTSGIIRGYSQVVEVGNDGKERIIIPCAITAHARTAAASYNANVDDCRAVVRRLALPSTLKTKGGAK